MFGSIRKEKKRRCSSTLAASEPVYISTVLKKVEEHPEFKKLSKDEAKLKLMSYQNVRNFL